MSSLLSFFKLMGSSILQNLRDEDFEQIEESILSIKIGDRAVFNPEMIKSITQDAKGRSATIKAVDFGFTNDETEEKENVLSSSNEGVTVVKEAVAQGLVERQNVAENLVRQ